MIYLDNAATTLQKPPSVMRSVQQALQTCANPGRGGHAAAMRAAEVLYRARETAASLFDAEPEQVVFTMNATHGLNEAILTLVEPGSPVVVSGFEHNAAMRPLYARKAATRVASTALFDPARTLQDFEKAIQKDTAAVIVNHVSNVFGYVQPLAGIAALCRERGVPLIVDASQSAGAIPLSMRELGAAFLAMPGHKGLYGPQGTGILLCGRTPRPLLCGGTGSLSERPDMPDFLPDRMEAGTQNVHGVAGLLAGMEYVAKTGVQRIGEYEKRLKSRLCAGLSELPGCTVFDGGAFQSGVVSFTVAGADCEALADAYARRGIAVRAGLHCAPLAHQSAGTMDTGTVRLSVSAFTIARDVEIFLQTTQEILKNERKSLAISS